MSKKRIKPTNFLVRSLPDDLPKSIKDAAGLDRSIAQEVDGNIVGDKSLLSLGYSFGLNTPIAMSDFVGYGGTRVQNTNAPTPEQNWDFNAIGEQNLNVKETPVTESTNDKKVIEYVDYIPLPLGYENLFDIIEDGNTPPISYGYNNEDWMYIPLGLKNLL